MTHWTHAAKQSLEDYFRRVQPTLQTSGADADEVEDDLRRHIDAEIVSTQLPVVTEEDVRRILARIGAPEAPPPAARPTAASASAPDPAPGNRGSRPVYFWLLALGVLLPVATLVFELTTRGCAGLLFDPLPTVWHVLLVASVPLINGGCWWVARENKTSWRGPFGWANGFALGIALFYALLFLPLTPFAVLGVVYFGIGLLPLSPLLAAIATLRLRSKLRHLGAATVPRPAAGWWWGLGLAGVALLAVMLPVGATRYWSQMALADSAPSRERAIRWLRAFGHEQTLLADCYGNTRWARENPLGFHLLGKPVAVEEARTIYFRVTGRQFNSVPPPQRNYTRGGWSGLNEFTWDAEQGGDAVAGRVRGLSLAQSRLDGLTDPDAAWSYVEWTLEFKNAGNEAREARAQVGLPPGGVVSRLTLWVNGEEREAAFAGRGQVREAYRKVVVVQKRDPVLVTSCGPDRVLVQCFPVPPDGGTIKVRLGITAPLTLESAGRAVVQWPRFLERNFSIPEDLRHSVWLESSQPLQAASAPLQPQRHENGRFAIRGQLSEAELSDPLAAVRAHRSPESDHAWVTDHTDGDALITQTVTARTAARPQRVVFVLDGTRDMQEFFPQIAAALKHLPEGVEPRVLLAKDGVEEIAAPARPGAPASHEELARRIRQAKAAGGQDNLPALIRAWDLAAESAAGVIVWIHGPQPVLLENVEALKQRFEWRAASSGAATPLLYDLQTKVGPNRVVEKLDGFKAIATVPRLGGVEEDLGRLLAAWRGEKQSFELARQRTSSPVLPVANRGRQASKHLTRLWAFEEAGRLIAARKIQEAVELAARYQLVTTVSGAVVLETAQQFQQAGLQPVDANSVPNVPEPRGLFAMILLLAVVGLFLRRRKWALDFRSAKASRTGVNSR